MRQSMLVLLVAAVAIALPNVVSAHADDEPTASPAPPQFEKLQVAIEGTFGEGWRQTVELPDSPQLGLTGFGRVILSVEEGWLCVRHESSDGQLEWQIVLCKVDDVAQPVIEVMRDMPLFVNISYHDGRYFVRESQGVLRAVREAASGERLLTKDALLSPEAKGRGWGKGKSPAWVEPITCSAWEHNEWFFVAAGPEEEAWRVVVRLDPMETRGGHGVRTVPAGHIRHFKGNKWLIDDGELLVAERMTLPMYEMHLAAKVREAEREAARKAMLAGGELPAIDAGEWLNTAAPLTWESLRGQVVLVDFWGTWCGPCVAKLPGVQALHEKYADRGLAVVGIHSDDAADTCAAFLEEHSYTFPVAIDTGQTAEAFGISGWPTYFLLDRSGKVVEGFVHNVPRDEAIEALLDDTRE